MTTTLAIPGLKIPVTLNMLIEMGACGSGMNAFNRHFPADAACLEDVFSHPFCDDDWKVWLVLYVRGLSLDQRIAYIRHLLPDYPESTILNYKRDIVMLSPDITMEERTKQMEMHGWNNMYQDIASFNRYITVEERMHCISMTAQPVMWATKVAVHYSHPFEHRNAARLHPSVPNPTQVAFSMVTDGSHLSVENIVYLLLQVDSLDAHTMKYAVTYLKNHNINNAEYQRLLAIANSLDIHKELLAFKAELDAPKPTLETT